MLVILAMGEMLIRLVITFFLTLLNCSFKMSWFIKHKSSWTGILPSITEFMSTFLCIIIVAATRIRSVLSEFTVVVYNAFIDIFFWELHQVLFSASVIYSKVKYIFVSSAEQLSKASKPLSTKWSSIVLMRIKLGPYKLLWWTSVFIRHSSNRVSLTHTDQKIQLSRK